MSASQIPDVIVVGAGISGCVMAERYAQLGKRVLVLEKRNHVGGNCYDYLNEDGILVPRYGPHFFHTNHEDVWEFVNRFTQWNPYEHRVLAYVDGQHVPVPVNIDTVNRLFALDLKSETDMQAWLESNTEKIAAPKNSEEVGLARAGRALYEKIFKNYTYKQWDRWPHELGPSVLARIPVRTNSDDRYFTDRYQAMPEGGYTKLFESMLTHPNIEVRLDFDYLTAAEKMPRPEKLFFTGPIDQFFNYNFGEALEYRSLFFEFETLDREFYQSRAQINFPNDFQYTRISEPKHATRQSHRKTTIIKEYSSASGEPYYPVPSDRNQELYVRYQKEAERIEAEGVFLVGRLANYKYFNMDQAFKNALDLFYRLETSA